jgi:hypothetical protein
LFQADSRLRARHAAMTGGFHLGRLPRGVELLHPLFDRCILARFGRPGEPGGHRIQIDCRQQHLACQLSVVRCPLLVVSAGQECIEGRRLFRRRQVAGSAPSRDRPGK